MSTKANLKAAKAALNADDFVKAIVEAQIVLSLEPHNYYACLFLGRALEKQGKLEDAEKSYVAAAKSKPEESQAWLGLCSVYGRQGGKRVDEYHSAAVKAAEIFAKAEDRHRCQTTIDKFVAFAKQHGAVEQYKRALTILLPDSPVYACLEGRIPHPSHTYIKLAEITEELEAQQIKQEISERRTRIGARIGQVTMDVKSEVFGNSELEMLYQHVIDWSKDDGVRREYEEKLMRRAYDVLLVVSAEHKPAKLDQVLTLAEGMVIIHHPFKLA
jgi:superkiller protein 3